MIGDLTSAEALGVLGTMTLLPRHGELILAFDPGHFAAGRSGNPQERAEALFAAILGQGARLPSQRRFAARARSEAEGIILSAAEFEQLDRFANLGLDAVG
jgi:LDH2 family malate/lactate/ureidoglycolate dehydrogenase